MAPTSGGAAALATQLERQALEIAQDEIQRLDIAAEVSGADMEVIAAWGARMYLLGLADRASVAQRKAPPAAPPEIEWCTCGHQKSAHGAGRSGAPGHGECLASARPGARTRCACAQYTWTSKAPGAKAAPAAPVRRRPRSDRREISQACAENRHRTPGKNGQCACGTYAIDDTGGGR